MSAPRLGSVALRERLLEGGEFALLDVRESRPFAAGHILTANNVPLSRLELRIGPLVPRKATAICLTDGGDGHADRAAPALTGLGYTDLAVHDGGAPAWTAAGFELFEGVNAPSKAFGEAVEAVCRTPALDAAEVKARIDSGEDLVVLDGRPWDEYREFNIPGGIDCPNSELAYRVRDLAPDPETTIVVNCAGRTRSIVGAQTLRNAGVANPVFALRNGTIGWEWAGFDLERGATRRYGAVSDAARAWSWKRCDALARRAGVETIGLDTLARWRREAHAATLYIFDVRDPEEHASGTLRGASSAQGTQLVQATDDWVAVRDARIVLVDDTGVRARVTAHWLKQLLYPNVAVLDADVRDRAEAVPERRRPDAPAIAPSEAAGRPILDLSSSLSFLAAHPAGAFWGLRSRLDDVAAGLPPDRPIALLDDEGGHLAALALPELGARGIEAALLDGGLAAWKAAGLALAPGRDGMLCAMDDVADVPFELADDPEAAKRRYIEWELQLPAQIERDGLLTFNPLV